MERETKEIITPVGKHKIKIYTYFLGGDKNDIAFADPQQAQKLIFERGIISIDGNSENIVDKILKMHGKDYDFILYHLTQNLIDSSWNEDEKKN